MNFAQTSHISALFVYSSVQLILQKSCARLLPTAWAPPVFNAIVSIDASIPVTM